MDNLSHALETVRSTGNYKLLQRLAIDQHPGFSSIGATCQSPKICVCLDTETTGFTHGKDKIIELGMISFLYDPDTFRIINILDRYNGLEDPGEPLSQDVINVTGITDEMLAGQHLDDEKAMAMLSSANIIIAHNAQFDRPFLEDRFPVCVQKAWACTMSQIDWSSEYVTARTLEYLLFKCGGWFIDAHRALNDAEGLLALLMSNLPFSGAEVFKALLEKARTKDTRFFAIGAPFDKKDAMKERGYRWSDGKSNKPKCWWMDVADKQEETDWLSENIYPNGNLTNVQTIPVTAFTRFSTR